MKEVFVIKKQYGMNNGAPAWFYYTGQGFDSLNPQHAVRFASYDAAKFKMLSESKQSTALFNIEKLFLK